MKEFDFSRFNQFLESLFCPSLEYRSLEKDLTESKNVNSELCSSCGGRCCKRCGCHFSPDDFEEISFEYLKEEIEKGYISIDYVDGEMIYKDVGAYILRVRNVGCPIVDTHREVRSQCMLLTENGCKLSYDKRPTGGKMLIPRTYFEADYDREVLACHEKYPISDCCYEWMPHQKVLRELVKYFK